MADADPYPPIQGEIIDRRTCDEQAALALVTAGALVAIADRHVAAIEPRRSHAVHQGSTACTAHHGASARLAVQRTRASSQGT
jgi:hypothetical protein